MNPRALAIAIPFLWLALFFIAPFFIVLKISLAEPLLAQPPYTPLFERGADGALALRATLGNFALVLSDPLYRDAYFHSIEVAAVSTFFCLLIGYPMAYAIARAAPAWRMPLLFLVILPFWTSLLIRVYAWMGLLKEQGPLNQLLLTLGVIEQPLALLHTDFAVHLGIVYAYLPFMVLPLYASLARMDTHLLEAAADLGARPWRAFWRVTWPLSLPGVIAGALLVFIPAVGEFVIPDLLGGPDSLMIGKILWTEFFSNRDWPVASALAVAMLAVLVLPIALFQHFERKQADAP